MKKITLLLCTVFAFAWQGNAQDYCGGDHFYDTGGASADYSSSETETTVISPTNSGDVVTVTFTSFDVESGWDGLMIYDGPDTSAPLIDSGSTNNRTACPNGAWTGTGAYAPSAAFMSTHSSGSLTFVFTSDGSVTKSGWDATVSCGPPPSCNVPTGFAVANLGLTSADLSWTASSSAETMWEVVYSTNPYTQPSNSITDASAEPGYTHVTATSLSLSGLTAGTAYDVYYRGHCGGTEYSDWVAASFSTQSEGAVCETAITVASLPYNTSDDTANYGDDYSGSPGASGCGTTSSYLNGDDVVYAYTATADASINIALSALGSTYSGMFVYTDCADIGTICVAGVGNSSTDDRSFDVTVTNGTTYYVVISTYASPQSTTYTLDITENTCTNGTASFAVVSDCAVSGGFNIEVAISDMGSATGLTVTDDQGSASQAVTAAGTLTFGPYDNGTDVVISMVDDSDATCAVTSASLTQGACPPSNDTSATAIALSTGVVFDSNPVVGTFVGATDSGVGAPSCSSYGDGGDVWFSVEVPTDGVITIETNSADGSSITDTGMEVYNGAPGSLVSVECDDDDSADGYFSMVELTGMTAGETLYVRVFEYGGNAEGEFQVSAYNATLTIEENAIEGFTLYPNPVKDQLQLQAQEAISKVTVYNLLGQKVLTVQPNVLSTAIDMAALKTGMYVLKVQVADKISTYRVLKQ